MLLFYQPPPLHLLTIVIIHTTGILKIKFFVSMMHAKTGDYFTITDTSLLRDVCISAPAQQISVALTEGNCVQSTHYGFLDVLGHSAMIAYILLSGTEAKRHCYQFSISQLCWTVSNLPRRFRYGAFRLQRK